MARCPLAIATEHTEPLDESTRMSTISGIPPFSFSSRIRLVVDPELVQSYDAIAFNAGRLDTSIVLNSKDYVRIAAP